MNKLEELIGIIQRTASHLTFNILEIGSMPMEGNPEPFHHLIHYFPGSQINAFEVDAELCNKLNSKAVRGIMHHAVALGRREEERPFYITNHPMCCSLYKPNEELIKKFNNMEVALLKTVTTINTVSLDYFTAKNNIGPIDFIKIDIQGAELDVFQGGITTLKDVVAIVTEVEFIAHYEDQPLFGDVSAFLAKQGLSFHNFLGMAGRALKPIVLNNDPNFPSQHIWTDALFLKDLMCLEKYSSDHLLKQAILASVYGIFDVSLYCLMEYDKRMGTQTACEMLSIFSNVSGDKKQISAVNRKMYSEKGASSALGRNDPCPCGSGKRYKNCHGEIRDVP